MDTQHVNGKSALTAGTVQAADQGDKNSHAALLAKIAELEAKNRELMSRPTAGTRELSFKVSEKGGVSVYGLGRFPVSLYLSQWERLLAAADRIKGFIEANRAMLKTKDEPAKA